MIHLKPVFRVELQSVATETELRGLGPVRFLSDQLNNLNWQKTFVTFQGTDAEDGEAFRPWTKGRLGKAAADKILSGAPSHIRSCWTSEPRFLVGSDYEERQKSQMQR